MVSLVTSISNQRFLYSRYGTASLIALVLVHVHVVSGIDTMEEFLENMLSDTVYDKRVRPWYWGESGKRFVFLSSNENDEGKCQA